MATQKNRGSTTTETGARQTTEAGSRQQQQQQQREGGTGGGGAEAQGAARSDQERQREVSRERGSQGLQTGGGAQRGMQQQGVQSGAVSGGRGQQQPYQYGGGPSLLPAFFSQPGLMASAFLNDPFEFASRMTEEMDRVFANFGVPSAGMGMGSPLLGEGAGRGLTTGQEGQRGMRATAWTPQIEVFQRENQLVVHADLPGLSPDDVNVEIEDGVLAISGERRQQSEHRDRGLYRSERSYGSFYRAIPLPEDVNEAQINASFRDGVLEVTVPLPEQQRQRSRRIQIRGANAGGTAGANDAGRKSEGGAARG